MTLQAMLWSGIGGHLISGAGEDLGEGLQFDIQVDAEHVATSET
ncbi:hypothetical protein ACBJ59_57645 [Nonomuraea sp. MTCD27]